MYRVSVLYGLPDDPDEFDRYYYDVHIPIAKRMKGLTRWTLTKVLDPDDGSERAFHMIADLYAPDKESMERILSSPEGIAARDDVPLFATGGVVFLSGYEEEVTVG